MPSETTQFKKGNVPWMKGRKGDKFPKHIGFKKGHKVYGGFQKGNKAGLGNKHTEEFKNRMKGNKFAVGWSIKNKEYRGEKHHNYIKDRTKIIPKQKRNDYAYKEWRRNVWIRDNWKCKLKNDYCNGRIEAHHIKGWTKYPELRYEISNGVTLCHYHHLKVQNNNHY